ncbi:MAG TPA: 30S ribosomal protein S1 [Bacteroidales bacterium]|nr:30S ribosomal protein S1 [Bacteroidales bacterium]HRR03905.1 30S ribosomal protein S1 [Bacteroidales bacterium]HRT13052.1 30S ribosomal protein S1 [Bacteroidales bacterium]HXK73679.1 30S ribosomal protein S1 [Bacteroidales bacterium]
MTEELDNINSISEEENNPISEQPVEETTQETSEPIHEEQAVEETKSETEEPALEEKPTEEAELETTEPILEEQTVEETKPETEEPVLEEQVVEEKPTQPESEQISETSDSLPAEENAPKAKWVDSSYGSLENFSWEALDKKGTHYTQEEKDKLEELYTKSFKSIDEQAVVMGTVVSINSREIVVNIGFKSDGVISASELRYNPNLKIGDQIEVYVESQENAQGQLQLSHKKARDLQAWQRVNEAHDNQEIVTGYVKCRTKGGLIVNVFGIEAFLPGSQIDVKPIRDYDVFVDKTMEFKVIKINHEYKNVVVSHKALIEDELEAQKSEIMAKLEKGQILEGTVKNITGYGVFIDLGGIDGLVHITDLSWGRITHPEEVVQLDEKINVVILDFDENKKRIALGLKQLTPHPWDALDPNLKVGDKVKGKVVVLADYGAFIEIIPGVEGLIHASEMSWSQHLRTAHDFFKVGDEVEAVLLTLDREERKMSLGIKQLIPDPWTDITNKYPASSKHTAIVRHFTNFGIFVELEEGVDGLIHISDLSWSKKIKHPAEFTKIGAEIEVVVLEVDVENRRLSLGHKQLKENPWDVFETTFTVGSVHEGTIISQSDKGVIVALPYGIEGFAFNRALLKEDGKYANIDETLPFQVIEFSKEAKRINLSHTRTWQESKEDEEKRVNAEERKKAKEIAKINESTEKTTLGDLEALKNLKEDLEKAKAKKEKEKDKEKVKDKEKEAEKEEQKNEEKE